MPSERLSVFYNTAKRMLACDIFPFMKVCMCACAYPSHTNTIYI